MIGFWIGMFGGASVTLTLALTACVFWPGFWQRRLFPRQQSQSHMLYRPGRKPERFV